MKRNVGPAHQKHAAQVIPGMEEWDHVIWTNLVKPSRMHRKLEQSEDHMSQASPVTGSYCNWFLFLLQKSDMACYNYVQSRKTIT